MRHSTILERDRTQYRLPLLLIALYQTGFHFAGMLMRLVIIAVGRLKQGPERELAERYRERFDDIGRKLGFRGLEIHEIPESRAGDAARRIAEEAAAISTAIPEKSVLLALDERGDNIDSTVFARHLGRWRDQSVANTIFAIGAKPASTFADRGLGVGLVIYGRCINHTGLMQRKIAGII